jgi:uncharacterized lipoprotein YmbA
MNMRLPLIIALACLLAACGTSPPTHFFTLAPMTPAGHSAVNPAFPIQVNAVHIPAVLDRNEMVRRTGFNTLSISDQDRWGAPFGEMARNVLAQDLAERLPQGSVIFPQAPAPDNAAHLVVTIATFGEDASGHVRLVGSWSLMRGNPPTTIVQRDVSLTGKAAGSDAASQAAGMSDLLAKLADQISGELSTASIARK